MTLTITTNLASIKVQKNMATATDTLNSSIARMTTGYKLNHASDGAAEYSIATNWETQLSSLDILSENIAMGIDMLSTAEGTYSLISSHLQRIRDLTEQASNGTYGTASRVGIEAEITARLEEINRIANDAEFNKIYLSNGSAGDVKLQIGLYSDASSSITLNQKLFAKASATSYFGDTSANIAKKCSNLDDTVESSSMLETIDKFISNLSNRVTNIGAVQNRLESANSAIEVQSENITSSLSTIKNADVAAESSRFIQSQILQQASATLLSTANQAPQIALSLI